MGGDYAYRVGGDYGIGIEEVFQSFSNILNEVNFFCRFYVYTVDRRFRKPTDRPCNPIIVFCVFFRIQTNYLSLQRINQEMEEKLHRMVSAGSFYLHINCQGVSGENCCKGMGLLYHHLCTTSSGFTPIVILVFICGVPMPRAVSSLYMP